MGDAQDRHVAYVRKVNEDIREFVEGLARENDRLSLELARVEKERAALERRTRSQEEELAARDEEHAKLMRLVEDMTSDNSDLHARLTEVMAQTNDLTNLYVSAHQLHCTTDYDEVRGAIRDIVINIIGSEDFVVLERAQADGTLSLLESFGVEQEAFREVVPGDGVIGDGLRTGTRYVANGRPEARPTWQGRPITACVPLAFQGDVSGLLVIFSLLPQKPTLLQVDLELFDLLSAQALGALHSARHAGGEG